MDIKVIEDFLTVAIEKNITKAANILNMTQPVLSRRLMGLEEEPLILPVRPGMKGEVESWFGKYSDRLNLAATGTTIIMLYSSFTCVDQWLRTCLEGRTESFKIDCIFHQAVSRRKRNVNIVLLGM